MPPPPARALTSSGQPISSPMATSSSAEAIGSVVPGMIGTPAACIAARARVLEPISSIASGGGPIQVSPASSTSRANAAFSARKPYPGWIASTPARNAVSTTTSPRR